MYAIVEIGGNQFKLCPQEQHRVPNLDAEVGQKLKLDKVILISAGGKVLVGSPFLKGSYVEVEVLEHGRGDKVVVFKKKRRKGYRRKRGHRQFYTEVMVKNIKAPKANEEG